MNTPENITALAEGEVFVFGSHVSGHHAGGAARFAVERFGAIVGQGEGLQGDSYAIPTMGTLEELCMAVERFIDFAHSNPGLTFYVTKIGTGIAGHTVEDVAPFFASGPDNVVLPAEFGPAIEAENRRWHRGDWMQTFTGRKFFPMDPRPEEINGLDIAHALSLQCRYNGHTTRFYSVAEHCVLLSYAVSPENALWALLHDASEAYVGDMIRPLKLHMPAYVEAEDVVMGVIAYKFGLAGSTMPDEVKDADTRILLNEKAELMYNPSGLLWTVDGMEPLPNVVVEGWSPEVAEQRYLARLSELAFSDGKTASRAQEPPR
jgi:uncharacterized protein